MPRTFVGRDMTAARSEAPTVPTATAPRRLLMHALPAFALGFASIAFPSTSWAEPLPFSRIAEGVEVRVAPHDDLIVAELHAGARSGAPWNLPATVDDVTVETVTSGGRSYLLVRARGRGEEHAAVVDPRRASWVWQGQTSLRGDPGERSGDALLRRDADGDGTLDTVVVGVVREGVTPCGVPSTLLHPRVVDARGRLVDWVDPPAGAPLTSASVATIPSARGLRPGPSSNDGATSAVLDTSDGSAWEGRRGDFARFQWSGPPLEAVLVQADAGTYRLFLDSGAFSVSIPTPGGWTVRLPQPTATSCVAIGVASDVGRVASLSVTTVGDSDVGLVRLVDDLVRDDADDRAVAWLTSLGPRAVDPVVAAWDRLGARGRRRALRVILGIATRLAGPDAEGWIGAHVVPTLALAASDPDEDVQLDGVAGLEAVGSAGHRALVTVALSELGAAPRALQRIHTVTPSDWALVQPALETSRGRESSALRTLAGMAWLAADRPIVADALVTAVVAQGIAAAGSTRQLSADERRTALTQLAERAIEGLDDGDASFETRYRLLDALVDETSPAVEAWRARQARSAPEWMIRSVALERLGARADLDLVRAALADAYPRVRAVAASLAASHPELATQVTNAARADAWPLVRREALRPIASSPEGHQIVLDSLGDATSSMRQFALELLRRAPASDALPAVARILADDHEWPHVTEAAIALASASCSPELGTALVSVVRRGVRSGAPAADLDNARRAFVETLRLGGNTSAEARALVAASAVSPTFELLLEHPPELCAP